MSLNIITYRMQLLNIVRVSENLRIMLNKVANEHRVAPKIIFLRINYSMCCAYYEVCIIKLTWKVFCFHFLFGYISWKLSIVNDFTWELIAVNSIARERVITLFTDYIITN